MAKGSSKLSGGGGLGVAETRRILGESADMRTDDSFVNALARANLEYDEYGDIKFKFSGKDKETGAVVVREISAYDKKSALQDIRANGFTVSRLYTSQVYDAILNHTDGEKWDFSDATKIDNALLKKARK